MQCAPQSCVLWVKGSAVAPPAGADYFSAVASTYNQYTANVSRHDCALRRHARPTLAGLSSMHCLLGAFKHDSARCLVALMAGAVHEHLPASNSQSLRSATTPTPTATHRRLPHTHDVDRTSKRWAVACGQPVRGPRQAAQPARVAVGGEAVAELHGEQAAAVCEHLPGPSQPRTHG